MITCKFTDLKWDLTWFLSAVYADCSRVTKRELWSELAGSRNICEGLWVVCGDFNVARFVTERTNGHKISRAMVEFSKSINDLELVDPLFFGRSFT